MTKNHTLTLLLAGSALLSLSSNAAITIHGSSTAYQETGGDWQTSTANDIDGNGRGTDGYIFFGQFDGTDTSGANGGSHTYAVGTSGGSTSLPSYVSGHAAGADFTTIADEFSNYGLIDDPNFTDGTDTVGGFALGAGGAAGTSKELSTFTVLGLTLNQTVRVGILGSVDATADGRWDPTSITIGDGSSSATVGNHSTSALAIDPGGVQTGWVFFDIDADGTYAVSATKRLTGQGASIGGITFDSVTVPEPSSSLLLGLSGLAFAARRRR